MSRSSEINPYAPPTARVDEVASRGRGYIGFSRSSTWGVFLLIVVSFGVYVPYWLHSRGERFNQITQSKRFSMGLATALGIIAFISFLLGIVNRVAPDAAMPHVLGGLVDIAYFVLLVSCSFQFRNCLNEHDGIDRQHPNWVGGLGTFFLHVLYLNYRLNQRIDAEIAGAQPV